jgi:hypothetical protein
MKVEEGIVHHKICDGHYTKQWIKIPKDTWTLPILKKRSTCRIFFNKAPLMKDDVKLRYPMEPPSFEFPLMGGKLGWDVEIK